MEPLLSLLIDVECGDIGIGVLSGLGCSLFVLVFVFVFVLVFVGGGTAEEPLL